MNDQPTPKGGAMRTAADQASVESLRNAMSSLYGYGCFALLTDIHRIATGVYGFTGSPDDAARLLASEPDLTVEHGASSRETRICQNTGHENHDVEDNAP